MHNRPLQRVASSLSRRVVRGYPKPWRDRYEAEVLALLDDSPARLRDVIDLARGLLVERARALFEPGDRPWLTYVLFQLRGHALALCAVVVTVMAGWVAGAWLGPAPRRVVSLASLFNVFAMLTLAIRLMVQKRSSSANTFPGPPLQPIFPKQAGLVWIGTLLAVTFLVSWGSPNVFNPVPWTNVTLLAFQMSKPPAWQLVVWRAVHRLWTSRHEMKSAVMELERCERLVAKGHTFMSAPLQEARDTVGKITRERDEALATLHGLGYRATLRTTNRNPEPGAEPEHELRTGHPEG